MLAQQEPQHARGVAAHQREILAAAAARIVHHFRFQRSPVRGVVVADDPDALVSQGGVARAMGAVLSGGDALEAVGGRNDGDTLVAAERMQIGIARDGLRSPKLAFTCLIASNGSTVRDVGIRRSA
jgi:hypothetical protein